MITAEQRQEFIRLLEHGGPISSAWANVLFPSERKEYALMYAEKEREPDILANTIAVPLQPVRSFGSNGKADAWHNLLIFGDNLQVLKSLVEMKSKGFLRSADGTPGARLVYIDPPFATMNEFRGTEDQRAYQDRVAGARFVEFLRRRLIFIREVMADNATIYVHLDTKKSHYIKVVLDEIFGENAFRNEIIWKRTNARSTSSTGAGTLWPRLHDCILVYDRGRGASFAPQFSAAESGKIPHTLITGPDGKKYNTFELTGAGITRDGESGKPWRGYDPGKYGRHWANSLAQREAWDKQGLIHWPKSTPGKQRAGKKAGFPRRRAEEPFDPESRTVMVGDVWTDIDRINQAADERTGYPTQKPEELLARIITASSREGDLVLDAFAGSGTAAAVAEKLKRRWVAIDCGKLAAYTIQKRLLNLREDIGNHGPPHPPRPFTMYNAGLYDFSKLKELPWDAWRFFALQLFQCKDETHRVGGVALDGKLKGSSVLVFDHLKHRGQRIDEDTIASLHEALGSRIGSRLFIVAPALTFDFQQDYIEMGGVRYYALRIPYSIIHELHQKEFTALKQPSDEMAVNQTVEAVGFDFVRTPDLQMSTERARVEGELFERAFIRIERFSSDAAVRGPHAKQNREALSMVMLDFDYDGEVFVMDEVLYAYAIAKDDWRFSFPHERIGRKLMAIFIDIYGNEARVLLDGADFTLRRGKARLPASMKPASRSTRSTARKRAKQK